MKLKLLHTGPLDVNTYVLYGETPNECIVIDPADAKKVLAFMQEEQLNCTHILLTHGHFDHILGVADLKAATGAKVMIHNADANMLTDTEHSLSGLTGIPVKACEPDRRLSDGDVINAAGYELNVISTPGHTVGGVCYLVERFKLLFVGDTLFRLSVGRSDLEGGSALALHDSIQYKLFTLPGDYKVYPGHMEETTLEFERNNNPFMNRWSPDIW